jgi:hypothetical protein
VNDKFNIEISKIIENNQNLSTKEINELLQFKAYEYNNTGLDDFDGLSPEIMANLLYRDWGENIIKINPEGYSGDDIPMIKQIRLFGKIIKEFNEIKLTKAGYLPLHIVKEIYNMKIIPDRMLEIKAAKLAKEKDVENIIIMRILCDLACITKKRNNKISLTKSGVKEINSEKLFEKIFYTAFKKYNWAYFDYYENIMVGQFGNNFTLYLLSKYGDEWKEDNFYAKLYLKAFPSIIEKSVKNNYNIHYINRSFRHLLIYFGIIEYENKELDIGKIRTTELFRKYIKIEECTALNKR